MTSWPMPCPGCLPLTCDAWSREESFVLTVLKNEYPEQQSMWAIPKASSYSWGRGGRPSVRHSGMRVWPGLQCLFAYIANINDNQ